ncbi:MAG: hypothetical protein V7K89_10530 [Nostoc sp.]|uniref:hypothetical protein n=1 Tax=Nostoc sp. TaxID=1180 RepID=UPI002FFABA93
MQRSLQKNAKSNQNLLGLAGKEWIQQTGDEWSGECGLALDGKDMAEKGKQKTRNISQLDTRSLQLKVRETGNSIITIETRTARESSGL